MDVKHEVALAWEITTATDSDAATSAKTLKQAQANLPQDRIEPLAFDKAADDHQRAHNCLPRILRNPSPLILRAHPRCLDL